VVVVVAVEVLVEVVKEEELVVVEIGSHWRRQRPMS
jgi:hypothetical protein